MSASLPATIAIFGLAIALASLVNTIDANAESEPDPFRLHRFRHGDPDIDD